jgi:hypothetical protein
MAVQNDTLGHEMLPICPAPRTTALCQLRPFQVSDIPEPTATQRTGRGHDTAPTGTGGAGSSRHRVPFHAAAMGRRCLGVR